MNRLGVLCKLSTVIQGDLITPGDLEYEEARKVWNGMIDRRPAAIAYCETVGDVVCSVNFARKEGISLTVRSGGHSIPGHSVIDDGLVIDLSRMNAVSIEGEGSRARVAGGALLRDLDQAAYSQKLVVPAGAVSHTGVAGLTLGGGFGHLMRAYGLTIDSLLEIEAVLADGSVVRANVEEHKDLFWAMRGGGGNFAIATEFVFQTHEMQDPYVGIVIHELPKSRAVLQRWREQMSGKTKDELNWNSFFRFADSIPNIPSQLLGKPVLVSLLEWHGEFDEGKQAIDRIVSELEGDAELCLKMPFLELQTFIDEVSHHGNRVWTKAGFFDSMNDDLIDTLIDCGSGISSDLSTLEVLPLGGRIRNVASQSTAFPHRSANFVFNLIGAWTDSAEDDLHKNWVRESYTSLEPFMSEGAYINYMSGEERDGSSGGFGKASYHLDRLRKIKRRYDPDNTFSNSFDLLHT